MLVLNARTALDYPVVWAVRMSIPFVWREVVWHAEWGPYRGKNKAGNVLVDGGVPSNFPIRLVAEPAPEIMGDPDTYGALNLGLLLDESLPVPGASDTAKPPGPLEHLRALQRVARLMDTMMGAQDNMEIREHASEICRLPVMGYGTPEFDMSDARLHALIEAGRATMAVFLAGRPMTAGA